MSNDAEYISIRQKKVPAKNQYLLVSQLKYHSKNPRIISKISASGIQDENERQKFIDERMKKHENVKDLKERIKREGGLMNPVVVTLNNMEVIEGNSRLAAYRLLFDESGSEAWATIHCRTVESLTSSQLTAFLSEEHIRGKKNWSAYERAYKIYDAHINEEYSLDEIEKDFSVSSNEVSKSINAIKLMKENNDINEDNFSYYFEVILQNRKIHKTFFENEEFRNFVLEGVKAKVFKSALQMRDNLPDIIDRKHNLKKLIRGELDFETASDISRKSDLKKAIISAAGKLEFIQKREILNLSNNEFNDFALKFRDLKRVTGRIEKTIQERKDGSSVN